MSNGPKWYLVSDTGNCYSPLMTLRFTKTSPFKYHNLEYIMSDKRVHQSVEIARQIQRVRINQGPRSLPKRSRDFNFSYQAGCSSLQWEDCEKKFPSPCDSICNDYSEKDADACDNCLGSGVCWSGCDKYSCSYNCLKWCTEAQCRTIQRYVTLTTHMVAPCVPSSVDINVCQIKGTSRGQNG